MGDAFRVGLGGPVGAGKTTLTAALARELKKQFSVAVITNDIYTQEDAQILTRTGALDAERIMGVETGGCPHTAIREDASLNLTAIAQYLSSRSASHDLNLTSNCQYLNLTSASRHLAAISNMTWASH